MEEEDMLVDCGDGGVGGRNKDGGRDDDSGLVQQQQLLQPHPFLLLLHTFPEMVCMPGFVVAAALDDLRLFRKNKHKQHRALATVVSLSSSPLSSLLSFLSSSFKNSSSQHHDQQQQQRHQRAAQALIRKAVVLVCLYFCAQQVAERVAVAYLNGEGGIVCGEKGLVRGFRLENVNSHFPQFDVKKPFLLPPPSLLTTTTHHHPLLTNLLTSGNGLWRPFHVKSSLVPPLPGLLPSSSSLCLDP